MAIETTTTAYLVPVFFSMSRDRTSSPGRVPVSPADAHSQAATMAAFTYVEKVYVVEETTYTRTDEDTVQDVDGHRPRAFMSTKK